MTTTLEILFNVTGQTLWIEPWDGRPSAVTSMQLWAYYADDDTDPELATTGAAVVATNPNTTLSAAAGATEPDPTALTLTSGTGVSRDMALLVTDDNTGVSEWIRVASVNGTAVKSQYPLMGSYSSGATVQTTRVSISVDPTWVADEANIIAPNPNPSYRLKLVATVGGETRIYERGVDLMRYSSRSGVTPIDVVKIYPSWLDLLPPDNRVDQGRTLIARAEEAVKFDLYGDNRADQSLRNPEHRARLVVVRANLDLQRDNAFRGADNAGSLALAERDWRQIYDQTIRSPVAAVDDAGGGAAATVPVRAVWVR